MVVVVDEEVVEKGDGGGGGGGGGGGDVEAFKVGPQVRGARRPASGEGEEMKHVRLCLGWRVTSPSRTMKPIYDEAYIR